MGRYPAFVILCTMLAIACAGCATTTAVASSSAAQRVRKTRSQTTRPIAATVTAQQRLTSAVAPLTEQDDGHVAVAVDDLSTGAVAADGGADEFDTASIVKVDILATLLYQAQQSGQSLTADEQDLATTMIENSDNDSASALYEQDGAAAGIDEANGVFGLSQTTVGTDGYWGLTTTTVDDQIRLLREVFTSPSALSSASQDYIQDLMAHVESDQQFGVSAAADPGTVLMLKDGWLPNPTLWVINSIGEVIHGGQRMLIAVLSDDNASEDAGISVAESVASKAADAVAGSAD